MDERNLTAIQARIDEWERDAKRLNRQLLVFECVWVAAIIVALIGMVYSVLV